VLDAGAGGHRHGDERDLVAPLGMAFEKRRECTEAIGDALGVVEPIDREDDPASPGAPAYAGGLTLGSRCVDALRVAIEVDAHREGIHEHLAVIDVHATPLVLGPCQSTRGAEEVAHVVVGVKSEEVGSEQTVEQLSPLWKHAEHLDGREGDVEEEADGGFRELLA
jgi:hypothetical protein